ncbi:MAG: YabP/YqfC family sporulation protein [Oscillospiraceae bacterium]|nr:YabP/YqfC family sporulation protein [Oscillospiraceae bacterium]
MAKQKIDAPRASAPHLELHGNGELHIDGCLGVRAYGEEEIRLDLGDMVLVIVGADLTMDTLRLEEAAVTGRIASLSFVN